jgi:hypothetical protein
MGMEISGCGRKRMKKASENLRSATNLSPYPRSVRKGTMLFRSLRRTGTMLSKLSKRVFPGQR